MQIKTESKAFPCRGADMNIDRGARWLSRFTFAVAIVMIGWGLQVVLVEPVTAWFATSATIWMALLLLAAFWQLGGTFMAIGALALATAVVARLFSFLRLHPPARFARFLRQHRDFLCLTGQVLH